MCHSVTLYGEKKNTTDIEWENAIFVETKGRADEHHNVVIPLPPIWANGKQSLTVLTFLINIAGRARWAVRILFFANVGRTSVCWRCSFSYAAFISMKVINRARRKHVLTIFSARLF